MPLYSEIKGEDIDEPKEEIVEAPTSSKTDKVRESLSLSSLHKAANPQRPPIPPVCRPKEDQKENPLKMKDHESFMVNISIGGKDASDARSQGKHTNNALLSLSKTRVG